MPLFENHVYCSTAPAADYRAWPMSPCPELPPDVPSTTALAALRRLLVDARLDHAREGTPEWNPLGELIRKGHRVVVKPNWVTHENQSGLGLDCLVTHTSVLEAILAYVVKADPAQVVVGDAPVQGCDFAVLGDLCGLGRMVERFDSPRMPVRVLDFRRTIRPGGRLESAAVEDCRPLSEFVLFDLGAASALEPISDDADDFRVTMYDPDLMKQTHHRGRHQYLVAHEVLDADVVISVPKLKTHKKACLTGAMKNIVGINGHKEYLPHHRKGGTVRGGDCYEGGSRIKSFVEDVLDSANRTRRLAFRRVLVSAARVGSALGHVFGENGNFDGSWHGNDTIWRTCLDLQRILHYGRSDGTLSDRRQRTVLSITDAIIAGEGEGPLAPSPVPFGRMTLGVNPAAMEWAHAILMGIDPTRVALIRHAFDAHRYPLADFNPSEIVIHADGKTVSDRELFERYGRRFRPAEGWRGHCELDVKPALTPA